MISLNGSTFLNNSCYGVSKTISQSHGRIQAPRVVAALSSNGRLGDQNVAVLKDSYLKETKRDGSPVIEVDSQSTIASGVEDAYAEDQSVTPWSVSVAR